MTSAPHHRKIQLRIGWTILVAGVLLAGFNLIRVAAKGDSFNIASDNAFNAVALIVLSAALFGLSRIDHPYVRLSQVILFALIGYFAIRLSI